MKIAFGYGVILLSFALSEALLAPTLLLNGDSTWHFKWASDILAAKPIFWSGVDANRIFPDLLFSVIAAALPGGQYFDAWVIYFCCVSAIPLGLSLILLSRVLYSESSRRLLFFGVSCAALIAVTTTLAFWSFQIMAPGYHGGSLSMVIFVIGLFLMNIQAERMNYLLLLAFVLICTLLVMSNRYLVVCLVVPLLIATLWATKDRRRQIEIFSATLLSTAVGLEMLHLLNSSNFYRLVAPGKQPALDELLSWIWWKDRLPKEARELADTWRRNQIILGLAMMAAAMIWGFWPTFLKSDKNTAFSPLGIFRLLVAISTLCGVLFVIFMVEDLSDWRYRYLTIPFCLAVITLSTIFIYPVTFPKSSGLVAILLSALSLVAASFWLSKDIWWRISSLLAAQTGVRIQTWLADYWAANQEVSVRPFCLSVVALSLIVVYTFRSKRLWLAPMCLSTLSLLMAGMWFSLDTFGRTFEKHFQTDLRDLSRVLADQDGMAIHNGFANYWIANEVSVRSANIRVLTGLTWLNQPRYWLYNDNAWELCGKQDFSFVLVQEKGGQPNVDAIVNEIGPPLSSQSVQLAALGPVQVLFYDPKVLDKFIVQPGRTAARDAFANFQCPNP